MTGGQPDPVAMTEGATQRERALHGCHCGRCSPGTVGRAAPKCVAEVVEVQDELLFGAAD